jgi:TPP-dependent pyruvate/acetoin dehydrogenase alpha subunit
MAPHSMRDEDDYRPADDKKYWAAKDPILLMEKILLQFDVPQNEIESIENDAKTMISNAFEKCASLPDADVGEVLEKELSAVKLMWGGEMTQ